MKAFRSLALLPAILIAGCAATSIQFDYKPRAVLIAGTESAGQALVLGQAYMRGYGDWVQLIISAVDDTQTLSALQMRPDINFLVPAGTRTLKVRVQLGNFMKWSETVQDPQVTAELEPGIVYQVKAREATNIRGEQGVDLWLERVGTREAFDAFLERHPGYKQGQPITQQELNDP